MKTIFIAIALLCSSIVFGQGVDEYTKLEKQYQKLEAELKQSYGKVLKRLTDQKEDGENEKRYRIEEQQLWTKYREAYCRLVAHQNNGSGSGIFEYQARIDLTKKRIKELKELLDTTD